MSSTTFACEYCHKNFPRLQQMKRHKRKHTGEKPFPCLFPGCGKKFSRSDNRFQHMNCHYKDGYVAKRSFSSPTILANSPALYKEDCHPSSSSSSDEMNCQSAPSTSTSTPIISQQQQQQIAKTDCPPTLLTDRKNSEALPLWCASSMPLPLASHNTVNAFDRDTVNKFTPFSLSFLVRSQSF